MRTEHQPRLKLIHTHTCTCTTHTHDHVLSGGRVVLGRRPLQQMEVATACLPQAARAQLFRRQWGPQDALGWGSLRSPSGPPPQSCPEAQCSSRSWRTPVGAGMSPGPAFRVHGSLCGLGCPQECFCMTPLRCPVLALRPCSLWGVRQKGRDMPQPTSQGWCCAQAQGPQDWPGLPGVGQQWPLAGSPRCPSTWDRGARGSAGLCQVPRVTV